MIRIPINRIILLISVFFGIPTMKAQSNKAGMSGPITYRWPKSESAQEYSVSIDRRLKKKVFRSIIKGRKTKKNSIKADLPYGVYRITIRPILKSGKTGPPIRRVLRRTPFPKIQPIYPEKNAIIQGSEEKVPVTFTWKASRYVERYLLKIKHQENGEIKEHRTVQASLTLKLDNKQSYEWMILPDTTIKPKKGPNWTSFAIGTDLDEAIQLSKPEIFQASSFQVTWERVSNAEHYLVTLYEKEGKKWKQVLKQQQKMTSIVLANRTSEGSTYQLRIRALRQGSKPSAITKYDFVAGTEPVIEKEEVTLDIVDLGDDQLPPTEVLFDLSGSYGGETLNATGVIGEFSGGGAITGVSLEMDILPKPNHNMMYFHSKLTYETFASNSTTNVTDSNTTKETPIDDSRAYGTFSVLGRSNLTKEFFGLGAEIASFPFPKFFPTNEEAGEGAIIAEDIITIGLTYHHRFYLLGGMLYSHMTISPLSSKSRTFALFHWNVSQRYWFGSHFALTFGGNFRYMKGTVQRECSTNVAEICVYPKSTQTSTSGLTGIALRF